jgi:hypothetical protein
MSRPYSEILEHALSVMGDNLNFWREQAPGIGIPPDECLAGALECELAMLDVIDDSLKED